MESENAATMYIEAHDAGIIPDLQHILPNSKIGTWLGQSIEVLDGKRPIDLIREGNIQGIRDIIYQVASGEPNN